MQWKVGGVALGYAINYDNAYSTLRTAKPSFCSLSAFFVIIVRLSMIHFSFQLISKKRKDKVNYQSTCASLLPNTYNELSQIFNECLI